MSNAGRVTIDSPNLVFANPRPELLARRLAKGIYRFEDGEMYKRCSRCKDYWPADSEFFYSSKRERDSLVDWCKACYLEWRYPNGRPTTWKSKPEPAVEQYSEDEEFDELEAA
ncbi:MAG: hypothetical protein ACAH07_05885 [Methylophilaceae bacterium]|nr:hypothetical protein [Methyloradius sp.]